MDYQKAIEILHPDTTAKKLAEIEYFGGFSGREKKIEAVNEACIVACEAMKELQQYKALGTLEEVIAAVERHNPKPPNWHINPVMEDGKLPVCPTCNKIMVRTEILGRTIDEHCVTCGQAIDWSNTYE